MADYSVKIPAIPIPGGSPWPRFPVQWLGLLIGCWLLIGLVCLPGCRAWAAAIVIDPGHGGSDGGAAQGRDFAEKHFTLMLGRQIADHLGSKHQVTLTRTSDIRLAPEDRAAVANHVKADLLVSIHAAVSPLCNQRQASLYVHHDERLAYGNEMTLQGVPTELESPETPWFRLQMRHRHQSRQIAVLIKQSLEQSPSFDEATLSDVPLVALMGADMPALLIEVGCIQPSAPSNPEAREKQITAYALAIARAIQTAMKEIQR